MTAMHQVAVKRLHSCNIIQNDIKHFNISSEGNTLCLLGSEPKVIIFEMHMSTDPVNIFPQKHTSLQIPSDKPINKATNRFTLSDIYEKANIMERQELAIDAVYMGEISHDPPKARTVLVECAPKKLRNGQSLVGILTTYGALHIYTKSVESRTWDTLLCDLNVLIEPKITVAGSLADVKSLSKFKQIVDAHWITAFTWAKDIYPAFDSNIIFLGSARGDIIGVSISEIGAAQVSSYTQTAVGRICYLRAFRDLLLVGSVDGRVEIFRYQREGSEFVLERKDILWDNQDRMGIRTAEISYSESLEFYFIVFPKSANLIAFQLSKQGKRICHSRILLEGVKITGLVPISVHEFICTTLSHIYRIAVGISENQSLTIDNEIQTNDLDLENYQIVGVGATPHNALLSLMLFRNKEYKPNYNTPTTACVQMCKLTTCDALTILTSRQISALGDYIDCLSAIYLDMRNFSNRQRYEKFFNVIGGDLPTVVDEKTLLHAQIKLWILKFLRQREKLKLLHWRNFGIELKFIERVIRMLHILCRIQYLKQLNPKTWTPYQEVVVKCMRLAFIRQNFDLTDIASSLDFVSQSIVLFVDWITPVYMATCENLDIITEFEKCYICQEAIEVDTFQCKNNHEVQRCAISYVQLPFFNNYACSQCGCIVSEEYENLTQLYPPGNVLSCPLCGYRFHPITICS